MVSVGQLSLYCRSNCGHSRHMQGYCKRLTNHFPLREHHYWIRSDEGLALETSALEFLYGDRPIHIINPVDQIML